MNRIIFAATALIGLALVAQNGSPEPTRGKCVRNLSFRAKTEGDFPNEKKLPTHERLLPLK